VQADTNHALHASHGIVLAHPDCGASIFTMLDRMLDGHVGGWAVMLGPIEFNPARNPRSQQSNKGRLDYILPVEEIVAIRFILADVDASANVREHHQVDVFVFKKNRFVCFL
jgi:hypothetical protein